MKQSKYGKVNAMVAEFNRKLEDLTKLSEELYFFCRNARQGEEREIWPAFTGDPAPLANLTALYRYTRNEAKWNIITNVLKT